MTKTIYVTIPDEKLQELIDRYSTASPGDEPDDFSIYLSLEELKRFRSTRAEPKARELTLDELREMDGMPVYIRMGDGNQFWAIVAVDGAHMWLYGPDYDGSCPDEDFYAMRYDLDPDGHFGLHLLGWLAYDRQPKGERNNEH